MRHLHFLGFALFILLPTCNTSLIENGLFNPWNWLSRGRNSNSHNKDNNNFNIRDIKLDVRMLAENVEFDDYDNAIDSNRDQLGVDNNVNEGGATNRASEGGATTDQASEGGVTCRDENGNAVDWWILYKLPQPKKTSKKIQHENKLISNGTAYTYMLPSKDKTWTLSSLSISDPLSLPGRTLQPLYNTKPEKMMSLLYNDELPDGPTSFNLGHTKGAVFGDEKSAVWLIHSVPHYPPYPNQSYSYPHTGQRYGQSYFCLSLPSASLDSVGKQLLYNEPYMYGINIPGWADKYRSLKEAASGVHVKSAPFYNYEKLETSGGLKLTSFAKFSKFGKDLYADLVAPALRTPLLVETWPNGPGRMPSRCSGTPFIVENVQEMDFPGVDREDFLTKHDHSKWAISLDSKRPFVCIGDINRMDTQKKRGGGTMCFEDHSVWKTFKTTIKAIEPCPRSTINRFSPRLALERMETDAHRFSP